MTPDACDMWRLDPWPPNCNLDIWRLDMWRLDTWRPKQFLDTWRLDIWRLTYFGHVTPNQFWTLDAQDKHWTSDAPDTWRLDTWRPTHFWTPDAPIIFGHLMPRNMTPIAIFGHLTPGHMMPYLVWTCDSQDKYWTSDAQDKYCTSDAQTSHAQKILDTWRLDIWCLDMWHPTQYTEWALNEIEITFYRTFTGWKIMHQGFVYILFEILDLWPLNPLARQLSKLVDSMAK